MRKAVGMIVVGLLVGCGLLQKPFLPPSQGGPSWIEVTTRHFTVATDHEPATAVRVADELEKMFALVSDLGFASSDVPNRKLEAIYLRTDAEGRELAKRLGTHLITGVFLGGQRFDYEPPNTFVAVGDLERDARSTLQHELTHIFIDYYYRQAPAWLHEGMAQYFGAVQSEGGQVVLGRVPKGLPHFQHTPWKDLPNRYALSYTPDADATPVKELIVLTGEQFYDSENTDDTSRVEGLHYASAYYLVRTLLHDLALSPLFHSYLDRLHEGIAPDQAWKATLGTLPEGQIQSAYAAALVAPQLLTWRTPYQPRSSPPDQVRTLTDGEARLYLARLWPWGTDEGRAGAAAVLAGLSPNEASTIDAVLVRAGLLARQANVADARALVRSALEAHPNDARLLSSLGWLSLDDTQKKALADLEPRLAPLATTVGQLQMVGLMNLVKRDFARTVSFEKRAVALDPGCAGCLFIAAQALAAQGWVGDALATAQLAAGSLRHGARKPEFVPQLTEIAKEERDRAAKAGAAKTCNEATLPPTARHLAPGVLKKVLGDKQAALSQCYDRGRSRNPLLAGRIVVRFTVSADGSVSDARSVCDSFPDPEVVSCVVASFRALVFPPPEGGPVELATPLAFSP